MAVTLIALLAVHPEKTRTRTMAGQLFAICFLYNQNEAIIPPVEGNIIMYALLRTVMGSLTTAAYAERRRNPDLARSAPAKQSDRSVPEREQLDSTDQSPAKLAVRPGYPTRMRVVLILSILSWLLIGLVIAGATGQL